MAEVDAHAVARKLGKLVPVMAADPVGGADSLSGRTEVEVVFETEWDYLPRLVADVAYHHGFAPVRICKRTPGHLFVLLRRA